MFYEDGIMKNKKLTNKEQWYGTCIVILLSGTIVFVINLLIAISLSYTNLRTGINKCSMGFAGTVPCSLREAILNNLYFFNSTIGVILYPLIFVMVLIIILIRRKIKNVAKK